MPLTPFPPGTTLPGDPSHHLQVVQELIGLVHHWSHVSAAHACAEVPELALYGLARVCRIIQEHCDAMATDPPPDEERCNRTATR